MTEPARRAYHHGNLADALAEVALRLVREGGAPAFSLRQAAREVGVDVAAVYRHYRDKEALLRVVAGRGFARMASAMEAEVGSREGATERLVAVGRAYVAFALAEPELFRLMFGPWGAGAEAPLDVPVARTPYTMLVDALEALRAEGRCAVPLPAAADAAWSAVHGFAMLVVDGPIVRGTAEHRIGAVLDVLVAGLGASPT